MTEAWRFQIGINSNAGQKHNVFLDLDEHQPTASELSASGLRSWQLWLSSPGKFWFTSFEHVSLERLLRLAELLGADERFIHCLKKNKYATLRISWKSGFKPQLLYAYGETRKGLAAFCKLIEAGAVEVVADVVQV